MLNEFKADIKKQHASPELVDLTMGKIRTEQKKNKTIVYGLPMTIVAAAVLLVCVFIGGTDRDIYYNEMDAGVLRDVYVSEDVTVEYITVGDGTVMIKSSTQNIAPDSLLTGQLSVVEKKEVYLGYNEAQNSYTAAFSIGDKNYYLYALGVEKDEFEKFLINMLEQ